MKLLKFYADWCGPCKMLSKVMEGMELNIPVDNIDIDKDSDAAIRYGVRGVPMLVLVDEHGNTLRSKTGLMSASELTTFIKG